MGLAYELKNRIDTYKKNDKMKVYSLIIGQKVLICLLFVLLIIGLSGCKRNEWYEAWNYYSTGKYQKAYDIFSILGNYKNSNNLARNSKLMIDIESAETMIGNHEYDRALALLSPYIDDGVDNKYAKFEIKNADGVAIKLVQKCELAIAGYRIDRFSVLENELSGKIYLADSIDNPRIEIRFKADNDYYIGETYLTDPADYSEEVFYGELLLQEYRTEEGYVFNNLDLSQFSFTIPKNANFYENDIFDTATTETINLLSTGGLIYKAIARSGKEGYQSAIDINHVCFNDFQKIFVNGELTIRLFSGDDVFLENTFPIY